MKRSGLNRSSGGTPWKRSKPLQQRSKKRERAYAGDVDAGLEGRRDFVERILAARPRCEIGLTLARAFADDAQLCLVSDWRPFLCGEAAVEVHEILRRSAGGDIVDDDNVLATCRLCHRWTHTHPKQSRELGLLLSRYARTPTTAPETT